MVLKTNVAKTLFPKSDLSNYTKPKTNPGPNYLIHLFLKAVFNFNPDFLKIAFNFTLDFLKVFTIFA